jgi:hypothetical protein
MQHSGYAGYAVHLSLSLLILALFTMAVGLYIVIMGCIGHDGGLRIVQILFGFATVIVSFLYAMQVWKTYEP